MLTMLAMVSGCGLMNWIFPDKDNPEPPDDEFIDLPGNNDPGTSGEGRSTILYVADMQGKFVLPINFDVVWEEGIAKAVVRHLVEGGPAQQYLTTKGLKAVLPAGTKILGMTVTETGNCIVDFSEEILMTADDVHEQLILDALTYTLTEFSTIDSVTIWVKGKALSKMPHGTLVDSVLTRERGVNSTSSIKGTGSAVTIYLRMDSLAGGRFLVPVTRPVAFAADLVASALEQLVGGPATDSGLTAVMPTTTRVQQLSMEGNTVVVDFSSDLADSDNLEVAVAAVVLTLTDLPNIKSVKMTIGGQEIQLSDGRILSEPVLRPSSTNPLAF